MTSHRATLEDAAPVLGVYYRALAGHDAAILGDGSDSDALSSADTHSTIRLPAHVEWFELREHNFEWYKVALTHRAAHHEGGTFQFVFDRPAPHFVPQLRPSRVDTALQPQPSHLEAFFALFARRELALDLFTHCEDMRLDEWLKRRYPGLVRAFERVQRTALAERPSFSRLPPRDALCEAMVRFTLGAADAPVVPFLLHEPIRQMRRVLLPLALPDATVEDSAEAAMRAYTLVVRTTNHHGDHGAPCAVDLGQAPIALAWPAWPEPRDRIDHDVALTTIAPVPYRDRLVSRYGLEDAGDALDAKAMYAFGDAADARQTPAVADAPPDAAGLDGPLGPMPENRQHARDVDVQAQRWAELHTREPTCFVYPEWDHVRGRYRRNWCLVRETTIDATDSTRYFDETVQAYGALVPEIRRQIERLAHEGMRRVHHMAQGDEIDLDAAIEAMADRRAGLSPPGDVYVARRKLARDVCVAFLVDMSFSTAERVREPESTTRGALALHGRSLHGRTYRTILDLEKESMALLMSALERVGDTYGIYCFSGSGRADVRFQVLKHLHERLSDRIIARLGNVRPVHTTRMGPAIRHATRKLRTHEATTRLLVLISDGRPFDLEYGQQYGEGADIEYAIRDTREALDEARLVGISPFVLTIDPQGNDYLRRMCDGLNYEVLEDVNELPARLIALYRGMTSG